MSLWYIGNIRIRFANDCYLKNQTVFLKTFLYLSTWLDVVELRELKCILLVKTDSPAQVLYSGFGQQPFLRQAERDKLKGKELQQCVTA